MNEPLDDEIASLYWCPYPDEAYARKVGWPVNTDGTITTPGIGHVPSRELCEIAELEGLYGETGRTELERLYRLEDKRPIKRRHVGFTGTRKGLQSCQKLELAEYLVYLKGQGFTHFHHGDAIGADAQAARLAKQAGFYLIAHPGHLRKKEDTRFRAFTSFNDEVREVKMVGVRDRDIVDETEQMIATPAGRTEEVRSGTWTTVRYARKQFKAVHIIYPPK